MQYNKMINEKLKENQLKMIRHYPQPMMFGGVRFLTNHPLPGNSSNGPNTLSTGDSSEYMTVRGAEGGNLAKSLNKIGKSIQKVGNKTIKAVGEAIPKMTTDVLDKSIVPALSKYGEKALTNYLMPAAESALETGAEVAVAGSRRRGRPRKLTKKQMEDVIDEFKGGSFKSVMKKVGKVANTVGKQVVNKAIPMAEKYAMNGLKTAVMDYALPAAEVGAETVAANPELLLLAAGRRKGGSFFGISKKKLEAPIDKSHGGKRKGRFVKGSQAAKDHMAKIRAMKK